MNPDISTLTFCPQSDCFAVAEVYERFVLDSTDGPVEMVRVRCVDRHDFMMPLDKLCNTTEEE